ncbi:MAG: ammonia-forming cytochrome c nitrite reductase subunit c552 [Candidatus Methanoperedens sp.]
MIKKSVITGIGILALLMLAGSAQATPAFFTVTPPPECSVCHYSNLSLKPAGVFFNTTHRFDGTNLPESVASCPTCHVQFYAPSNFSLTSTGTYTGQGYNRTHRYNDTTLASTRLDSPGCANCHVDVPNGDFTRLNGTPTYLTSTVCIDCHKAKYDDWRGTNHANKLMPNVTAQADNLPLPAGYTWTNVSYVVIGLSKMYYLNESGYINWSYNPTSGFSNYVSSHGNKYSSCGGCHTTGYNSSGINALPGIVGTWSEPGIACERCHKQAGNGHQVVVNYSAHLCEDCHGDNGWDNSSHDLTGHSSGTGNTCSLCHQPFNNYKNASGVNPSPSGQSCAVCHNPHDMTPDGYRSLYSTGGFNNTTMAVLATEDKAKLSFFNATASVSAATDIYDTLTTPVLLFPGTNYRKYNTYGAAPINVTGPVSEVLCSMCHYEHGLGPRYIANVSLTHGRNTTTNISKWATCTDCHYQGAGGFGNHSLNTDNVTNSCSRGTECHVTSDQNATTSINSPYSLVPVEREWNASLHNDKDGGGGFYKNASYYANQTGNSSTGSPNRNNSDCMKCHSPENWNPGTKFGNISNFRGITCGVCHDVHDMGEWINKTGKVYAWFNRDAFKSGTTYISNYSVMANTTELCGNCHSNANPRLDKAGPGYYTKVSNISPLTSHGRPAKDIFSGSWKQTGLLNFECIDCHWSTNITDGSGTPLNDSEKVMGHSFKVNETLLQNDQGVVPCSNCHATGSALGNLSKTIDDIQIPTHNTYNTTNVKVQAALKVVKNYWVAHGNDSSNLSKAKIAEAVWDASLVSADLSWGVHNLPKVNQLLADASRLADESNASLGLDVAVVSTVQLKAGLNLVSLQAAPAFTSPDSVMSSVRSNITAVWGYNASTQAWQHYDPNALNPSSNDLATIQGPPAAYAIYANTDCVWTT